MTFEEWWNENGARFMADSCHMSEYHMASVAWSAGESQNDAEIRSYNELLDAANIPYADENGNLTPADRVARLIHQSRESGAEWVRRGLDDVPLSKSDPFIKGEKE